MVTRALLSSCSIFSAVQPKRQVTLGVGGAGAQDLLGQILRQALILLEEERLSAATPDPAVLGEPVLAHQVAVGGEPADRVAGRQQAGSPQLFDAVPEVEVL
jgi:hypothetical protein